jgi:hypothetical protein
MGRETLSSEEQAALWRKLGLDVDDSSAREKGDVLGQPAASSGHSAGGSEADAASIAVSALERKVQDLQRGLKEVGSEVHREIEKAKAELRAELRQGASVPAQVPSTSEAEEGKSKENKWVLFDFSPLFGDD